MAATGRRVLMLAVVLAGCGGARPAPPKIDPDTNFAAHRVEQTLGIDRLPSRRAITTSGRRLGTAGPELVLRDGTDVVAALWPVGRSRVLVRTDETSLAPSAGEVMASWADGAIRLQVLPATGRVLATDVFVREGGGALDRNGRKPEDVRGIYRADLRTRDGAAVGWLRVNVGPPKGPPPLYDGIVPADLGDGLAVALALVLDGEVRWIEDHAAK